MKHKHTHAHKHNFAQTTTCTHTQSVTHTCADTLSLFQSFFGWHFLGLLSLHELFTPPLSLAVSNTDLMGRERERQRQTDRETQRERVQSGR